MDRVVGQCTGIRKINRSPTFTSEVKVVRGIKKQPSDCTFMERKEMAGGQPVCKTAIFGEAVKILKGCHIPEFENDIVEVREIKVLKM